MMSILASVAVLRVVQGTHITDTVGRSMQRSRKSIRIRITGKMKSASMIHMVMRMKLRHQY